MPPVKRYFHCSQEIIADPEIWEMINEFGDRFILTWLQILIYLERTDNHWRLTGDWLAVLSRSVRQSSAKVRRQVGQLVAKEWLLVGEVAADGSPLVLKGRNWLKYNKSRYPQKDSLQTASGIDTSPLRSVPFPSVPKDKEEEGRDLVSTKPSTLSVENLKQRREALESFAVTDDIREWARKEFQVEIPTDTVEEFKDHWRNLPDKKLRTNWKATFQGRIRQLVSWGTLKHSFNAQPRKAVGHEKVVL